MKVLDVMKCSIEESIAVEFARKLKIDCRQEKVGSIEKCARKK